MPQRNGFDNRVATTAVLASSFVKLGAAAGVQSTDQAVAQAGAGDAVYGIADAAGVTPTPGGANRVDVCITDVRDGSLRLKIDAGVVGTVRRGQALKAASTGLGTQADPAADHGKIGAIALEDGVAGNTIAVQLFIA